MKKLFVFIVSAVMMISCGEDLEFNTPALQGQKDGALWRADYYSAEINSSGQLVIKGGRGSEIILLRTGTAVGTYILGEGSSSEAVFTNVQDVDYSTNNEPDEIIQIYPADGEIVITGLSNSRNTVSGTFWFNAFSESGLNKVNYSQGVFYQVPVSGGSVSAVVSCDDAVAATAAALVVYDATDEASADFPAVCNAYKSALTQQITSCGDDTNTLQDIIDGLDCGAVVVIPGGCQTCSITSLPDTEYCDNGDGTMTVSISGAPASTIEIPGGSFNGYILALEGSGYSCN